MTDQLQIASSRAARVLMRDVSFAYRSGAPLSLQDFSLEVLPGETLLLTGVSGSGKTSVTRLVNGLVPHFYEDCQLTGDVRVGNVEPACVELHDITPLAGSVFQSPKTQFFCLNTTEELAFSCENLGLPASDIRQRIAEVADEFSLKGLLDRNPFDLSGGEAQRVACGAAAMLRPAIMVLDEPSSNLDAESIWRLRALIATWRQRGCTIVISEHRIHYLEGLVDRVCYIQGGKIERIMPGRDFYALPLAELHAIGLRAARWQQVACDEWAGADKPHTGAPHEGAAGAAISVAHVKYAYAKSLQGIDIDTLSFPRGGITALIGPNGAGKSTFARCVCGLTAAVHGTIDVGRGPEKLGKRTRHGFLVMQNVAHQLFRKSVLAEVMEAQKVPDEAAAREILCSLDLQSYACAHPLALSGGQMQRVALATALASGRDLLVLDEPTSGLDLLHMRQVARAVQQAAGQGRAVVVITHDLEFIQACCTHFVHLEAGRVVQTGSLDDAGRAHVLDFFEAAKW